MARTVAERYVSLEDQCFGASFVGTFWCVLFFAGEGFVALRLWTGGAFVDFRIGVTQSDGDVSDSFFSEPDSVDAGNGPDYCGLSVGDMADCTNVEGSLATDDLRGQWMECVDIFVGLVLEVLIVSIQLLDFFFGESLDVFHGASIV